MGMDLAEGKISHFSIMGAVPRTDSGSISFPGPFAELTKIPAPRRGRYTF